MAFPGGMWDITAGGVVGVLILDEAPGGALSGTIFGDSLVGFFDAASQTLTFCRNPQLTNAGGFNNVLVAPFTVYQGSFFQFTSGGTTFSVLSGAFSTNTGNGTPTYTSWYAQNPAPVKTGKEGKDGKDSKDGKEKDHKDGKDGVKDGKEKDHKDGGKEAEFIASAPFMFEPLLNAQSADASQATGRPFIEAEERPSVGEAALQDTRAGADAEL